MVDRRRRDPSQCARIVAVVTDESAAVPAFDLTDEEARVLGCLIEKSFTTPDAYPLSLNAIRVACNQTTNRDPITHYDDDTIGSALDGLRTKQLARRLKNPGERAIKHRHVAREAWAVDDGELALLTVLFLRGAQTPGELKQRTERLHAFASLDAIEGSLASLAARSMVVQLERRPGQKELRWIQLATPFGNRAPAPVDEAVAADSDAPIEATLEAHDVNTGELLRSLAVDTEREVEAKLDRARRARDGWSARTVVDRRSTIGMALDRVAASAEQIASVAARQTGGDADGSALALLDSIDAGRLAIADESLDRAVGVVAFVLDARATLDVAPLARALAAGSVVLVKPAASNVVAGLMLVDELHAAGVPADVVQCIVGAGATGAALVHAGADHVWFVGGHDAGWRAARRAGDRAIPIELSLR